MKSYLKFLSRNKLYTVIEAVGLALSLAFVILIGSYVVQQFQVAHENPDGNRIYIINLSFWDKEEIEMSLPEVDKAARLNLAMTSVIQYGAEKVPGVTSFGMEVDPEFFDLFPYYEWKAGSPEMFKVKNAVVLSESMARRLIDRTGGDFVYPAAAAGDLGAREEKTPGVSDLHGRKPAER